MNLLKRFLLVSSLVASAFVGEGRADGIAMNQKFNKLGLFGTGDLTDDKNWVSINASGVATLAGGIDGLSGTFSDEGSIVLLVMHGIDYDDTNKKTSRVRMCPMQIQSANKEGRQLNWIRLFVRGDCADFYDINDSSCDSTDYSKKWANIGVLTSGGTELTEAQGWYSQQQSNWKNAEIRLFAVEKILPHGVMATAVKIEGMSFKGSDGSACPKGNVCSTIKSLAKKSASKLFCAKGYIKNSAGTDCVAVNSGNGCKVSEADMLNNLCSGYSRTVYQRSPESWQLAASIDNPSCYVYYCPNTRYGFKSTSDHTCVKCPNRSGQQKNGLCATPCEIGKSYYVSDYQKDGSCVADTAYSKTDMMYGRGKTKNSQSFENSCWTIIDNYKSCVENGGQNKSE